MRSSDEKETEGKKNIPVHHLSPSEKDPLTKFLGCWPINVSMITIESYETLIIDL